MTSVADDWAVPPPRSLQEIVKERIIEAIRSGELKPGERIVETALAKRLNVSRGPLREALKSLEALRLVESRRAKGTFVAAVSEDEVLDMMITRSAIEGLAARLVAVRGTREPAVLETLEQAFAELERFALSGDVEAARSVDWRFHELVCELSENAFLLATWDSIGSLVRLFQTRSSNYAMRMPEVLARHRAFLDGLRSGDPDVAERTFRAILITTAYARLDRAVPASLTTLVEPARS